MLSVAQEIDFLSRIACVRCDELKHLIVSANFEDSALASSVTILNFTPPENLTWIVTRISLRAANPTAYLAGTPAGDFRSEDYDWNGLTNAWITVAGNPIVASDDVTNVALFNRPVLLVFEGGKAVRIRIRRDAASLPSDPYQVMVVVNGYLAPTKALNHLARNSTQIEQP